MTLPVKKLVDENGDQFTDQANLVTSFQTTPDDTHYPSEKLVYEGCLKTITPTVTQTPITGVTVNSFDIKKCGKTVMIVVSVITTGAIDRAIMATGLPEPPMYCSTIHLNISNVFSELSIHPDKNLRLTTTGAVSGELLTFIYLEK